ncbi:MAG: ABC transporter ATP-binding protein [Alphaproteobacteria bacterium]|nr:MAG: ABC transporter ATP-binding protein [Alphaproteobacteria bacterium]
MLALQGLVAGYEPGLPIVRGASLQVADREILTLLGPNGAGKSTLVKAIAGLVPITAGQVHLSGRDITGLGAHRLARAGLGFVPQTENVFTTLSIAENLALAGFFLPSHHQRRRVAAMYALFPDLAERRHTDAGRLSGGQRQMLAIARALIPEPRVVMLDEPSAGLSPKLVQVVFQKLVEIRAQGVTLVIVEQNAKAALAIADRGIVLVEGAPRFVGPAQDLASNPEVARLYLGRRETA